MTTMWDRTFGTGLEVGRFTPPVQRLKTGPANPKVAADLRERHKDISDAREAVERLLQGPEAWPIDFVQWLQTEGKRSTGARCLVTREFRTCYWLLVDSLLSGAAWPQIKGWHRVLYRTDDLSLWSSIDDIVWELAYRISEEEK